MAATPFTADTARATGLSEPMVRRDAKRGEKVISEVLDEVLDIVRGTELDTGACLNSTKDCR